MAKTTKQVIGEWGENQASLFLSRHGYEIVDKNYCIYAKGKKAGEVDIIAWNEKHHFGRTLCFVEVKTRTYGEGSAERATQRRQKLAAFFKTARQYCLDKKINIDFTPIQFEQVSVYLNKQTKEVKFKKYEIPVN
jgi:Holliday junction resolvase-like predicted endonuclease